MDPNRWYVYGGTDRRRQGFMGVIAGIHIRSVNPLYRLTGPNNREWVASAQFLRPATEEEIEAMEKSSTALKYGGVSVE